MSDAAEEVPEGAAVFPLIPAELGVNPLLLAVLHAAVFLSGSTEDVVHPAAADEAFDLMAGYLRRLRGDQLRRAREDVDCLVRYARQEKWPRELVHALKVILEACGVGEGETEEEDEEEA
jgi:hypothetical protein